MTMKQAQARCRRLKAKGDKRSLVAARKLEAQFRDRPDYESDQAFFLRMQADPEHLFASLPAAFGLRR